jgi:hypothetical protein
LTALATIKRKGNLRRKVALTLELKKKAEKEGFADSIGMYSL